MDRKAEIVQRLSNPPLSTELLKYFGEKVQFNFKEIECLKDTRRSSIWKLNLNRNGKNLPVILKIYTSIKKHKNQVEINFLKHRMPQMKEFMAEIYLIASTMNGNETWVLMENVQQLRGQIKMNPDYFAKIIPSIAALHATTFEGSTTYHTITKFLPIYQSSEMVAEREVAVKKTIDYLDDAMENSQLQQLVKPYHKQVRNILKRGPDFFPKLISAGKCVIHGDLHMQNICCNNVEEQDWHIKLIDWETARCSPCWIDLAILVEILIDFRKDWRKDAENIRYKCVHLYTEELRKYGITFTTEPMKLYKMAYLQRTLEKGLYTQMKRELQGRPGVLLEPYLRKIKTWGTELHIYE